MKWVLLLLMSAKFTCAAELIVIFPADSGDGFPVIYPFADIEFRNEPKMEVMQENQLMRHTYKDVPAGKYRVAYGPMGPLGYVEKWMETHVSIAKGETKTVYLFRPDSEWLRFPEEVIVGLREAKKMVPEAWVQLEARYQGAADAFLQYRDLGEFPKPERLIHYLRTDAAYTLQVHGEGKVIYEVKFRVEDAEQPLDPFAPQKPRKFVIEKPAPAEKAAKPE